MVDCSGNNLPPITFLSGFHGDYKDLKATTHQQKSTVKAMQQLNAAMAGEDHWNYSGNNSAVQLYVAQQKNNRGMAFPGQQIKVTKEGKFQDTWCTDVFFGIGELCTQHAIPFFNAECRHYSNAAARGYSVSNKEMWQSYMQNINTIFTWTDDADFLVYPDLCAQFLHNNDDIVALYKSSITLPKIIASRTLSHDNRKRLGLFGSEIVNARILHGISIFEDKPHIFVCAGDNHCKAAEVILEKRGYEELLSVAQQSPTAYNFEIHPLDIEKYFATVAEALKKHESAKTAPPK